MFLLQCPTTISHYSFTSDCFEYKWSTVKKSKTLWIIEWISPMPNLTVQGYEILFVCFLLINPSWDQSMPFAFFQIKKTSLFIFLFHNIISLFGIDENRSTQNRCGEWLNEASWTTNLIVQRGGCFWFIIRVLCDKSWHEPNVENSRKY